MRLPAKLTDKLTQWRRALTQLNEANGALNALGQGVGAAPRARRTEAHGSRGSPLGQLALLLLAHSLRQSGLKRSEQEEGRFVDSILLIRCNTDRINDVTPEQLESSVRIKERGKDI